MDIREYVRKLRRVADALEDLHGITPASHKNESPEIAEVIRKRVVKRMKRTVKRGKYKKKMKTKARQPDLKNRILTTMDKKPLTVPALAKKMGYKSPAFLYEHVNQLVREGSLRQYGDSSPKAYEVIHQQRMEA